MKDLIQNLEDMIDLGSYEQEKRSKIINSLTELRKIAIQLEVKDKVLNDIHNMTEKFNDEGKSDTDSKTRH